MNKYTKLTLVLLLSTSIHAKEMFTTCKDTKMYRSPNVYSTLIMYLERGKIVDVLRTKGKYATSTSKKDRYKNLIPDKPIWAQTVNGYIHLNCLGDVDDYKKNKTVDRNKFKKSDFAAKKNFSQEEEGELVAMKGMAGKGKAGKANYYELHKTDVIYKKNAFYLYKNFRKEGLLGENYAR